MCEPYNRSCQTNPRIDSLYIERPAMLAELHSACRCRAIILVDAEQVIKVDGADVS